MQTENLPPDWDPPPRRLPAHRLVLRVAAFITGALLVLAALAGFVLVALCSNLFTKQDTLFGMQWREASRVVLASLSASALGLLLVEYGAVAIKSRGRLILGIASACLLAVAVASLFWRQ